MNRDEEFIGIDVGEKRIGLARVNAQVGIAQPLSVLDASQDETVYAQIRAVAEEHHAIGYVVGLPRGLDGQETQQTLVCRKFAAGLAVYVAPQKVYLVDEAGSSKEADLRLQRGSGGERDSVAAAVVLEDFVGLSDRVAYEVAAK